MEKHDKINYSLGTALLLTIITSIFSLPSRLSTLIVRNDGFINRINIFIKYNILWIIVVSVIIVSLSIYIKKSNERGYLDIFQNENIRLITGILVSLDGLINLSKLLPSYIMSIQASLKIPSFAEANIELVSTKIIISDIISVTAFLCEIFFGVYLAKYYKKKIN